RAAGRAETPTTAAPRPPPKGATALPQRAPPRDDPRRLLLYEVLPEPVLPVHLDDEPAEVPDPLLAMAEERAALAPQAARRRQVAPAAQRLRRLLLRIGTPRATEERHRPDPTERIRRRL